MQFHHSAKKMVALERIKLSQSTCKIDMLSLHQRAIKRINYCFYWYSVKELNLFFHFIGMMY